MSFDFRLYAKYSNFKISIEFWKNLYKHLLFIFCGLTQVTGVKTWHHLSKQVFKGLLSISYHHQIHWCAFDSFSVFWITHEIQIYIWGSRSTHVEITREIGKWSYTHKLTHMDKNAYTHIHNLIWSSTIFIVHNFLAYDCNFNRMT